MVDAAGLAARIEASWLDATLDRAPWQWRGRIAEGYRREERAARAIPAGTGRQSAALAAAVSGLLDRVGRLERLRLPVGVSDSEIVMNAQECARECLNLAGSTWPATAEAIRARIGRYVAGYGIEAPGPKIDDGPAISRMTDVQWWRRGLRAAQARELEAAAINLGYVHKGAEVYASDATVERRAQQRRRNARAIDTAEAVNLDTGEVCNLSGLVAASVANPRIRRGELMTRVAGFEAFAKGAGHVSEFWTATCPSRMHKMRASDGRENRKYDGTTPRDAHKYLGKCWARFRAAIARRELRIYGFRIAEPHHDGTPHWHLLIFSPEWLSTGRRAIGRLRALFRRYFLEDSSTERGARERRCEFKRIDMARGSAAAYIAKYIAKNIDGCGYQVQGDFETGAAIMPGARVEAWASTWGIRQFQQVGGPPVGVWRELRRLHDDGEYSDKVEAARVAADCGTIKGHADDGAAGNWRRFVEIMGGPTVRRMDQPIRIARTREGERWNSAIDAPCPAPPTRYGEISPGVVFGVRDVQADRVYRSDRCRWVIRMGMRASGEAGFSGRLAGPWTRVNNCTERVQDGRCEMAEIEGGCVGGKDGISLEGGWRDDAGLSSGHDHGHGSVDQGYGRGNRERARE